ncbi:MAG: ABC transporter ATP-binding protein [Planctomycetes bacterium]|nr:ABC transporter ATP-binding protein [Planctomycetota bacterium]
MVEFRGYQEEALGTALDLTHLRRLWPFVRPYRAGFLVAIGILAVSFAVELAGPYVLRLTLDGPVADAVAGRSVDRATIWWLGAAYLAVTLLGAGLGYAYALVTTWCGQRVIRDVRSRLFEHVLGLGPRFFETNPAGKLVTRVTSDVENLNELIATGVLQSLFDLLKIVGILAALFWIDPVLALYTLAVTPVVVGISLLFRRFARDAYRRVRTRLARQNAFTAEAVGGMRTTRVFLQEDAVRGHYHELNRATQGAWIDTVVSFSLFFSVMDFVLRASQAGILWFGGQHLLEGTLSVGAFGQFWLLYNKLTDPIRELGEKYNVLQSAFSSSERIFQILDRPPDLRLPAAPRPTAKGPAALRFEHVWFAYREGMPVLQDIDLAIAQGQVVAVVGPTGAGKTTLLSLLSRLRDPDSGRVLLDGVDLRDLDLTALRRRIAVVQQDVFLFTGTVLDNVRLFDPAIPEAKAEAALRAVGAWEFVQRLPDGLHAKVEERGATFSQGERQLLSFARAIAHDPDVLILDEATANIDTASEARIQEGLRVLLQGRTSLVVAHRLSTVQRADRIVVLQRGRIVEDGDHASLLARGGLYARMLHRVG